MKRTHLILGFLTALVASATALAQSEALWSGYATPTNANYSFYFEAHLKPPSPGLSTVDGGMRCCTNGVIHRYLIDPSRRVYFGYDVLIEPQSEPNTYRATFSALSVAPPEVEKDNPASWTRLSTPGWGPQPARTMRSGEVVSLTLLTNSATGQTITDYVTIQEPPRPRVTGFNNVNQPPREFTFADGPARDFRPEDAELTIRGPRLSVNGKLDLSTVALDSQIRGAIVYFYAPNRGRFLLSLAPQPGFSKSGEIRGTTLTFKDGADAYNLITATRIAPGDAAFHVYVLHQPSWRPTYTHANLNAFILGTADRSEFQRR